MRGWIAFFVVLLVGMCAFVIYELIPKDSVKKATVNEAVVKFRKEMRKAAGYPKHPGAQIPPFGVYRYFTRGSEGIDSFAFSTAHNYGGVSTVSLTPIPCGVVELWQPLITRWSEARLCVGPKTSRVVGVREFHQFFEKSKLVSYACVGPSSPYAQKLRPGMRWETKCTSDTGAVVSKVKVVDLGKVRVADKPIDAVHLRSSITLKGDPDGTDSRDSWIRRSDGLLLRRIDNTKAHVNASGGGEYSEHYEIDLISTRPQR